MTSRILNTRLTKFVLLQGLCLFLVFQAQALPKDLSSYDLIDGGMANIEDGAYVEGSSRQGGIQPDYRIDLSEEPLKTLMRKSEAIGLLDVSYWEKVALVLDLVRGDFFRYTDYYNPYYRRLLKKYRENKTDVPLSEYGACSAGVCREHALVLHFALKSAGIENRHAYAKIYRASRYHDYQITEDHAFNVVEYRGVKWAVDAYYWGFNGFKLDDLMSKDGITENSKTAPIADPGPGTRRILEILSFPRIYNPKTSMRCSHVL